MYAIYVLAIVFVAFMLWAVATPWPGPGDG